MDDFIFDLEQGVGIPLMVTGPGIIESHDHRIIITCQGSRMSTAMVDGRVTYSGDGDTEQG